MKDVWDLIKKFGALTGLIAAITGWIVTYMNFRNYVNSTKERNEKVEAFMANQNSINERSLVLYELYIHGRLPGAEGEAEEGETAEVRIPYREGYNYGGGEYTADADGYYAFETAENVEGIGPPYRGGEEEKGGR